MGAWGVQWSSLISPAWRVPTLDVEFRRENEDDWDRARPGSRFLGASCELRLLVHVAHGFQNMEVTPSRIQAHEKSNGRRRSQMSSSSTSSHKTGCDPWRLGVPIIHSLGDQTPPFCLVKTCRFSNLQDLQPEPAQQHGQHGSVVPHHVTRPINFATSSIIYKVDARS